jgi:(S)-mandelate dehydrogenase
MGVDSAVNYHDLERLARRRLPKIAFDFIQGGVDGEIGLDRNEQAFRKYAIVPRYMVDIWNRSQATTLFGQTFAAPFGIAPTGAAALFRRGSDLMLAEAARDANIPFIMSGAATATMEELAKVAPQHSWYQLYPVRDETISDDIVKRVEACGFSTLVVTVDVPVDGKRERNIRNGFARPVKPTPSAVMESLMHPSWIAEYLGNGGQPAVANYVKYAGANATARRTNEFWSEMSRAPFTWTHLERLRKQWPRNLVVKGVMHPDDARRIAAIGCDGIMVSNHGARQLDTSPSPLEVLPAIVDAVGDKLTVMLDSGIRRGSDALIALCLGAKFVFVGRWTLYGVTAGGLAGAKHAVEMIRKEIDLNMGQMGCPDIKSLGPQWLMTDSPEDLVRNRRV